MGLGHARHYPAAWSPESRRRVVTADGVELEGEIVSVDLQTGAVTMLTDNDAQDVTVDWRPDPSLSKQRATTPSSRWGRGGPSRARALVPCRDAAVWRTCK
jgi:hypothetical protein